MSMPIFERREHLGKAFDHLLLEWHCLPDHMGWYGHCKVFEESVWGKGEIFGDLLLKPTQDVGHDMGGNN